MIDAQIDKLQIALRGRNYDLPSVLNVPRCWIIDKEATVNLSLLAEKKWLRIENPLSKDFLFIPLDGQNSVFGSNPPPVNDDHRFIVDENTQKKAGACDCLIIDEQTWNFIEFKIDSYTDSLLQINENRKKAELQIARTLTFFREKIEHFDSKLVAVIVVPNQYGYPRFKASKSRAVQFKLKWKKIDLFEVNLTGKFDINRQ